MFNSDPMQIFIKISDNWRSFLNHELMHAMLFLTGQSQGMTEDEEEGIVMAIETGIKSLLILDSVKLRKPTHPGRAKTTRRL